MDISTLSVTTDATVRDVIGAIDANGRQIALVVDADTRLRGVVTDGDIRRGILRGVSLDAPVSEIMNATPRTASSTDDSDDILAMMNEHGIRHVPVIDARGVVTELITGDDLAHARSVTTPVVLMAGGRGQRLYPLTKDVPKPMLPIGDVPLLEIILRNLASQGFVNVYISVNYLAEVIENHVGDGSALGLNVTYVHEDKPLGTAGALAQLNGVITEPFVVMNSDLLTHVNLRRLLNFHVKQGAQGTVGVREHVFEIPYGVVNLDGTLVESMVEKPLHRSLVNAGIYALEPAALALLPEDDYCDMPTLLSLIMQEGQTVSAFPIHEQWLDVGRPEDLNQARSDSETWVN
ncbi:MAG: nucleotidyltransferase family protein [Microbacteriaceae bacterium]